MRAGGIYKTARMWGARVEITIYIEYPGVFFFP